MSHPMFAFYLESLMLNCRAVWASKYPHKNKHAVDIMVTTKPDAERAAALKETVVLCILSNILTAWFRPSGKQSIASKHVGSISTTTFWVVAIRLSWTIKFHVTSALWMWHWCDTINSKITTVANRRQWFFLCFGYPALFCSAFKGHAWTSQGLSEIGTQLQK